MSEICVDDIQTMVMVAEDKARKQGALEEQYKTIKILQDINYLLDMKRYEETKDFIFKWIIELKVGAKKQ